jgi:ABC-2 type transport system permease protein
MSKLLLIIKREYTTRIRNKTFILSTILTPVFFIAIMGLSIYFSHNNSDELKIAVYDESSLFQHKLKDNENISYSYVGVAVYDSFASKKPLEQYSGVLHIPVIEIDAPAGIEYLSSRQLGIFSQERVNDDLNAVLEKERMIRANIDTNKLAAIKEHQVSINQKMIGKDQENTLASAGLSSAIGYCCGFLIYIMMFIYGTMVMRGVMEEKVSRVAEVVISSVKPMQLLMGKIIGIGAVGLTQFLIWIALIAIGTTVMAGSMSPEAMQSAADPAGQAKSAEVVSAILGAGSQMNIPLLIGAFIFYFIGGYLFYAALFAAVGSAVNEDPQDAQAMMLPITIPIIFSIIIMTSAIGNPTAPLAVWCSIIPFTSPVIMMARLPFGFPGTVAWWELALSVAAMIGGFLFTSWLSARIYRTGILMYGKKATWKEMLTWVFRKS